ncbi:GNAT family N-acetyltransferase [Roseovarius sp. S4756]|uniref:GNAT family N-acetyltransferase n=1 Tax=Roseovarius maritimus TaxID=3342637 RepID=UPI00372860C8
MILSPEILDPQDFSRIRDEWQALFDRVPGAAWSCAPEIYNCWRKALRKEPRDRIIAVRTEGGLLAGLFPVSLDHAWRGPSIAPRFDYNPSDARFVNARRKAFIPVRQATGLASLPGTMLWLGPLCREAERPAVCDAVAKALLCLDGWDVGVFPAYTGPAMRDLRAGFVRHGAEVGEQALGREVQNVLHLKCFEDIVVGQGKKFRQNVRRARRTAEKYGLRVSFVSGSENMASVMPMVADLARQSWKHEGRAGNDVNIPYHGPQQAFFEALMTSPRLGGMPAIGLLHDAEGPIVVYLLVKTDQTVSALLTFWNGRAEKASPGLLLLGACMDWALEQGATRFDYNTTSSWVRYLADSIETVDNLVVFRPGLRGRLLGGIARLRGRVR